MFVKGRKGASLRALKTSVASNYRGKEFAPNDIPYSEMQLGTILYDAIDQWEEFNGDTGNKSGINESVTRYDEMCRELSELRAKSLETVDKPTAEAAKVLESAQRARGRPAEVSASDREEARLKKLHVKRLVKKYNEALQQVQEEADEDVGGKLNAMRASTRARVSMDLTDADRKLLDDELDASSAPQYTFRLHSASAKKGECYISCGSDADDEENMHPNKSPGGARKRGKRKFITTPTGDKGALEEACGNSLGAKN